MTLVATVSCR